MAGAFDIRGGGGVKPLSEVGLAGTSLPQPLRAAALQEALEPQEEALLSQVPAKIPASAGALARQAAQTATQAALAAPGGVPLFQVLARVGREALEALESPASRSSVGEAYVATIAEVEQGSTAGTGARNLLRLVSPAAPGADSAYLTFLAAVEAGPAREPPDASLVDPTVSPREDLYHFAGNRWLAAHPLPPTQSCWDPSRVLQEEVHSSLLALLNQAASETHPPGSRRQLLGDFYASALAAEPTGLESLRPVLARVEGVQDTAELARALGELHNLEIPCGFEFRPWLLGTTQFPVASQGGLTLTPEQYRVPETVAAVRDHVRETFLKAGDSPEAAARKAEAVVAVESALSQGHRVDFLEMNRMLASPVRLSNLAGGKIPFRRFSWASYLQARGRPDVPEFLAGPPEFFRHFDETLATLPVDHWKAYLSWQVLHSLSPCLSSSLAEDDQGFRARLLGKKAPPSRELQVLEMVKDHLEVPLGQEYVAQSRDPEAEALARTLIEGIKEAACRRLEEAPGLSGEARQKLAAAVRDHQFVVGTPESWPEPSSFSVDRGSFLENVLRARQARASREMARIGAKGEPDTYGAPFEVNAYNLVGRNVSVLPPASLQPPLLDPRATPSWNYGNFGTWVGHELSHMLDPEVWEGQLPEKDLQELKRRVAGLPAQAAHFVLPDGMRMDGSRVRNEAFADLGGAHFAFDALCRSLRGCRQPFEHGLTPEQEFFVALGRSEAEHRTPEARRQVLANDSHPDSVFRVNWTASSVPGYLAAFGLAPGDPMARSEEGRVQPF